MNKYSKMRRAHFKVRKYFEKQGGLVFIIQHTRFQHDIFNLWDGFIILNGIVSFVQIKSNRFPTIKPYKDFCEKYDVNGLLINVPDRKEIKIKQI